MEHNTYLKCACCNCGEILEYIPTKGVLTITCPKCHEKSGLPDAANIEVEEHVPIPVSEIRLRPKVPPCPTCHGPLNPKDLSCPFCRMRRLRKLAWVGGVVV